MWDGARVRTEEAWVLSLQIILALGLINVRGRPVNKYTYRFFSAFISIFFFSSNMI